MQCVGKEIPAKGSRLRSGENSQTSVTEADSMEPGSCAVTTTRGRYGFQRGPPCVPVKVADSNAMVISGSRESINSNSSETRNHTRKRVAIPRASSFRSTAAAKSVVVQKSGRPQPHVANNDGTGASGVRRSASSVVRGSRVGGIPTTTNVTNSNLLGRKSTGGNQQLDKLNANIPTTKKAISDAPRARQPQAFTNSTSQEQITRVNSTQARNINNIT